MKKYLSIRFFTFYLFFSLPFFALSQKNWLNLDLQFHEGSGPFIYVDPPVLWDDTSALFKNTYAKYTGIPKNLKEVQRAIIVLDRHQYAYQNYISGNLSKESFSKMVSNWGDSYNQNQLIPKLMNIKG